MINTTIPFKIFKLLSQMYAFDFEELQSYYDKLGSVDEIIKLINIANEKNISLKRAFIVYKENK